jgi:hypothetical protein
MVAEFLNPTPRKVMVPPPPALCTDGVTDVTLIVANTFKGIPISKAQSIPEL